LLNFAIAGWLFIKVTVSTKGASFSDNNFFAKHFPHRWTMCFQYQISYCRNLDKAVVLYVKIYLNINRDKISFKLCICAFFANGFCNDNVINKVTSFLLMQLHSCNLQGRWGSPACIVHYFLKHFTLLCNFDSISLIIYTR